MTFLVRALATLVSRPRGPVYIIGTCSSTLRRPEESRDFAAAQRTFILTENKTIEDRWRKKNGEVICRFHSQKDENRLNQLEVECVN